MEPIEYKLIPYPNQEGEWLIINNQEPKVDNIVIDIDNTIIYVSEINGLTGIARCKEFGITFGMAGCKVICGSSKFIHKSISLIIREQLNRFIDNINEEIAVELAYKTLKEYDFVGDDQFRQMVTVWLDGYNKHAETNPFTESQMIEAIYKGSLLVEKVGSGIMLDLKHIDPIIKSLQQQPKKEYIVTWELEYKYCCWDSQYNCICELKNKFCQKNEIFGKKEPTGYINILSIN